MFKSSPPIDYAIWIWMFVQGLVAELVRWQASWALGDCRHCVRGQRSTKQHFAASTVPCCQCTVDIETFPTTVPV